MSAVLSSFDPSHEFYASVSADGRLNIWNVDTRKVQHQFTQSAHLQVNYTCMRWGQTNDSKRLVLALGTHVGDVFCWDVKKATQLFHWKAEGPAYPIFDLCFSKAGSLFICGESPFIIQREVVSGNIFRKIKADKKAVLKVELNRAENCLISSGKGVIKVWDLSSGELITKLSGHRGGVNGLSVTGLDQYLYSSSQGQRIVNMWSLTESDNYQNVQTFSCSTEPSFITSYSEVKSKKRIKRKKSQAGDVREVEVPVTSFLLAIHGKRLSIWQFSLSMQQNKPLSPNTTLMMPKPDQDAEGIEFLSASFISANQIILARGNALQPRFEKIVFRNKAEMEKRIQLKGNCSGAIISDPDEQTKANIPTTSTEVNVVDEIDTRMPARPKLNSASILSKEDITLEEKLEQIEAARKSAEAQTFQKQNKDAKTSAAPSADSVGVILLQALESGDTELLETCLTVDDLTMIQKTVERLPNEYILSFLNTIIQKFQSEPNRAAELVPWIQTIVMIHTSYLLTIPDLNASALFGLYQTIDSRLSSFNQLLKLSGRLDLLLSQISYREVSYRENVFPASSLSIDDIPEEGSEELSDMEDSDSA